jgi:cytochrome P450
MTVAVPEITGLDLADPLTYVTNDMPAVWRRLRQVSPVLWHGRVQDRPGFWAVTRYEENQAVYRDHKRFSTERGNMLATLLSGGDSAGGRMVSVTDGGRHKDLRQVILRAFSPAALERIAGQVREYSWRLLREAIEAGGCDFARDVASRVPINTICDLLGVPGAADREHLLSLNKRAVSSDEPDYDELDSRIARNEIVMYFLELVHERRKRPGDDVVSVLGKANVEGEPLSDHDIVLNCYSLLLGGDETSRFSMTGGVHALATFEQQWRNLRAGAVDLATATEEIVRWCTPIMHIGRVATVDVPIGDVVIKAGDVVTLWNSSANRDERVFDQPDVLDLSRSPNKHLGFGFGAHFCLGVYLARAEIFAIFDGLRRMTTRIELAGQPIRLYSNVLDGFSSMPVSFHPDRAGLLAMTR